MSEVVHVSNASPNRREPKKRIRFPSPPHESLRSHLSKAFHCLYEPAKAAWLCSGYEYPYAKAFLQSAGYHVDEGECAPTGGPCSACNAWREFDPWHPCTRCHKPVCNTCAWCISGESIHVCPACVAAEKAKAENCADCERAECAKHTKNPPPKPRATCTVTVFGMAAQSGRPCGAPAVESGPHGHWCRDHWVENQTVAMRPAPTCTLGVRDASGAWPPCGKPAVARYDHPKHSRLVCERHAAAMRSNGVSLQPICGSGEYATLAARQREGKGLHEKINERAEEKRKLDALPPPVFRTVTTAQNVQYGDLVFANVPGDPPIVVGVALEPAEAGSVVTAMVQGAWPLQARLAPKPAREPHGPPDPSPLAAECGAWVAPGRYCNTRVSTPGAMCEACFKKYDALEPGERPRPEGSEPDPLAREYAELHDHAAALRRGCSDLRGDIQRERRVLAAYLRNHDGLVGLDAAKAKAVDSLVVAGGYKREAAAALVEEWTQHQGTSKPKNGGGTFPSDKPWPECGHWMCDQHPQWEERGKPKPGRIARARAWLNRVAYEPEIAGVITGAILGCGTIAAISGFDLANAYGLLP